MIRRIGPPAHWDLTPGRDAGAWVRSNQRPFCWGVCWCGVWASCWHIRYPHELIAARKELVARDLIAYENGIYQVLQLPPCSSTGGRFYYQPSGHSSCRLLSESSLRRGAPRDSAPAWESLRQLLERSGRGIEG